MKKGEKEGGIGLQVLLLYFNYLESWEDTRLLRNERGDERYRFNLNLL